MSWLPKEKISSFVTIILWQKKHKENMQYSHFTSDFCAELKLPMTCTQRLY